MDKKTQNPTRSWLVILLVGLAVLAFYKMSATATKPQEIPVTEFVAYCATHTVTEPIYRVLDHDEGTTYLAGETTAPDGAKQKFIVNLVPGENEKLMDELKAAGHTIQVHNEANALSPAIMNLLFLLLPIALLYWLFMRRMGGDGGPFSMGKSRAKMLTGKEEKKRATFADVAGIDEAKEEVQEIVSFLKEPAAFQKLGGRIPKGVLLVGPPGTGKTLLARAIAGEAGVPFFAISGSDFEEMFVGVGASRMRDMFAEAKKRAPCIVFIDEIDSIGQKRSGAGALTGSHAYEQTLNTMLVEMDGFDANEGVIVIAATNRPDTLDAALLRPGRFDRQVNVELPTLKGREEILLLHGKKIKFAPDADVKRVARGTPGFSGADLANLLNEAALMAVRKKLEGVDMATLDEARDKVLWGRERKSAGFSAKERETTAWHEAGHALLQVLLPNADPLHKVTIIPRGRALGATMALPKEDVLNRSKSWFRDQLVICCGGRIAEKLFTDDLSTGAAQDIRQATDIARGMVCRYGMSERFGFQSFSDPNTWTTAETPPATSEATAQAIDAEVAQLLAEAYAHAEKLILDNRDKLEKLAKTLFEKESMDGRDVEALIKGEEI